MGGLIIKGGTAQVMVESEFNLHVWSECMHVRVSMHHNSRKINPFVSETVSSISVE